MKVFLSGGLGNQFAIIALHSLCSDPAVFDRTKYVFIDLVVDRRAEKRSIAAIVSEILESRCVRATWWDTIHYLILKATRMRGLLGGRLYRVADALSYDPSDICKLEFTRQIRRQIRRQIPVGQFPEHNLVLHKRLGDFAAIHGVTEGDYEKVLKRVAHPSLSLITCCHPPLDDKNLSSNQTNTDLSLMMNASILVGHRASTFLWLGWILGELQAELHLVGGVDWDF